MTPDRISNANAVEAVDSQLRSLYRCFRDFGPKNPPLATALRQLHNVLKALRLEAHEHGPLHAAIFARQLAPILKECDVSLKVFATIVRKYRPSLTCRSNSSGSITSADSKSSSDISGHSFGYSSTPVSVAVSPLAPGFPVDHAYVLVGPTSDDQLAIIRSRFITHATRLASLLENMKSARPPYPSTPSSSPPPPPSSSSSSSSPAYFHSQSLSPARRSPSSPHISHISPPISPMPDDDDVLETLKDRIDAIAVRLAHQDPASASHFSTASIDELWTVFNTELSYEGFSGNTLSEHKNSLRAYIQDLGSRGFFNGTDVSSPQLPLRGYFRSLPNYMVPGQPPAASSPQGYQPSDGLSPKEVVQPIGDNEKYHHRVKDSRLAPQPRDSEVYIPYRPAPAYHGAEPRYIATPPGSLVDGQQSAPSAPSPNTMATRANTPRTVSMHHHSSSWDLPSPSPRDDSEETYNENGFNFISTRRLLEIDWRDRNPAAGRLGVAYTPPQLLEHGSHPSQTLPALATSPTAAAIVRQNSLQSQMNLPPPPSPSRSSFFSSAPHAAFGILIPGSAAPPSPSPSRVPAGAELGPDSFGKPIPPDAVWTRITRKRVSPEVLVRAGVRFEARPTFVAILGVLSREQIAEYARQSVEARRSWRHSSLQQRNEKHSPLGTSPPEYKSRPERRQSTSGAGSDKQEREAVAAAAAGLRAQTFPLAGSSPRSRDRDSSSSAGGTASGGSPGRGGAYPFIVSPPATEVDTSGTEGAPKSILKNKNKNKVRYRDGELVEVSPDESSRSRSHRHGRSHDDSHRHRSKSRAKSRHRDSDSRRDSSRHRDDEREHRRDRDRSRRRDDSDRDSDRERDRERERERERERDRDRTRNPSRHRDQDHDSSRRRHHHDHDDRSHDRDRDDTRHRDRSRERRRDRDHERERDRTVSHQKSTYNLSSRSHRDGHDGRDRRDGRDRDRDSQDRDSRERDDGRKRLRDTLSAAGIGGVAGSFISVLTEAASSF